MAKERKLSKAEEAEVMRRKGNRYFTGASDKAAASPSSGKNMYQELGNKDSNVVGKEAAKRRIGAAGKVGGSESDSGNTRTERIEALRAIGELTDKEAKRKKAGK